MDYQSGIMLPPSTVQDYSFSNGGGLIMPPNSSSTTICCNCHCHRQDIIASNELLTALVHFLETDLAGEELSVSIRPRYRQLLERVRLEKIAHCSAPTEAVAAVSAKRRGSLQPSTSLLGAVVRRNKDLKPNVNATHRLSLPSQVLSACPLPTNSNGLTENGGDCVDYESPAHTGNTLLLPSKRNGNRTSRRMSAFLEQSFDISGPLSYRSQPTRWLSQASWQRFAHCILHGTSLLAYKTRGSSTPSLKLNLAGYTALYVEKEGSMHHVIKLTHICSTTHVLAADTEEQARAWVQHLDSHSSNVQQRNFTESADFGAFYNLTSTTADNGEPDSGFSGPHSSSSNSNESCEPVNGTVYDIRGSPTRQPNRSASLSPSHQQNLSNNSTPEHVHSRSLHPSKSDSFMRRISTGFRDSIGSGRRKRQGSKALFQNMQSSRDAVMYGVVNIKIPAVTQHWYRRFVQLKPNAHLEVFGLDSDGSAKLERQILIGHLKLSNLQSENTDDVRDKKHSSAMRFYTEDGNTDILYLEILDKLESARWIKALIQVMNLTPSYEPVMELIDLHQARDLEQTRRASLVILSDEEGENPSPVHRRPLPPVPGSTTDLRSSTVTSPSEDTPDSHPYQIYDIAYNPPPGQSLACLATEESLSEGSDNSANTSPATTLTKSDSLRALLMRRSNNNSLERCSCNVGTDTSDLCHLQQEVNRLRRQRRDLHREDASTDRLQYFTEEIERTESQIETLLSTNSIPPPVPPHSTNQWTQSTVDTTSTNG